MLRLVVVAAFLASACAAPSEVRVSSAGFLEGGAATAAPEGLAEYCVRAPAECGAGAGAGLRGRSSPTGASGFQRASGARSEAALFHALLAQRTAAPLASDAFLVNRSRGAPMRVTLSAERVAELARINRRINRAIRPERDLALYGIEEYWTRPLGLGGAVRGDCEDYALEKRAALIAAGWPVEALSLAVAVSPRVGLHAVLVVSTDQGDFVLDNLYDRPQAITALDYAWLSRQSGADLTAWTSVRLVGGAPSAARGSALFQQLLHERTSRDGSAVSAAHLTTIAADAPAANAAVFGNDGAAIEAEVRGAPALSEETLSMAAARAAAYRDKHSQAANKPAPAVSLKA